MGLWEAVIDLRPEPRFPLLSREEIQKVVETALQEMNVQQEACQHLHRQRYGPSYVLLSSGGVMITDSTYCRDCSYSALTDEFPR